MKKKKQNTNFFYFFYFRINFFIIINSGTISSEIIYGLLPWLFSELHWITMDTMRSDMLLIISVIIKCLPAPVACAQDFFPGRYRCRWLWWWWSIAPKPPMYIKVRS